MRAVDTGRLLTAGESGAPIEDGIERGTKSSSITAVSMNGLGGTKEMAMRVGVWVVD